MPTETERLSAVRAALMQTASTPGWFYAKRIAGNVVDAAKDAILEGTTPAEREERALKAQALKKGFEDLFKGIEAIVAYSEDRSEQEDEWFANLSFDTEEVDQ